MPKNQLQRIIDRPRTAASLTIVSGAGSGGGGGVTDHGLLSGLGDPADHPWALTTTTGDLRYVPLTRNITATDGLTGTGTLAGDLTLRLASTAAGAGLTYTTGVLAVGEGAGLTVSADTVALTTPGTLTVATSNTATGSHTHAITSSSAPGATASILATDANGVIKLAKVEVGTTPALTLWGTNDMTTNPDVEAMGNVLMVAEDNFLFGIDSNASGTGAYFAWQTNARTSSGNELMRLTETGRLGIGDSTPSYELDVNGTGQLQTSLITPIVYAPTIATASGNLTLTPYSTSVILSDGKAYTSESFAGGFTGNGFRIDQGIARASHTTAEFDDLVVRGRMSVYELLIRQIRATNGAIFVSSTAKVTSVSGPSGGIYTLTTDEETPHGFLVNDVIRAQRVKWNGSTLVGIYQSDMVVTGSVNLYTFRATLASGDAPDAGYEYVRLGNTGNADRRGTVYLTADDTNAPYIDIVDGVTSHADWNTAGKIKGRYGKLTGITSVTNEYGLMAGNGFTDTDKYIKASTEGVLLNNVDIQLRSGSTQTGNIANNGTFWFGPSSTDKRLSWDGTTLSIVGSGTFTGSITASSGSIAGWTIDTAEIKNSTGYLHIVSGAAGTARIEVGDQTTAGRGAGIVSRSTATGIVFWAGEPYDSDLSTAPFTVTSAGALKATNATLTGSLTAGNVSINSGDAIRITATSVYGEDRSLNWYYSTSQIGYINVYGTGVSGAVMTLSAAGLLLNNTTISSVATTVDFGDAAVEVLRIKAATATGYLRSSADGNVLSWSSTGVGVTGTFSVSSTSTFTGAVSAPSVRAASGTWYAGVGSTNYLSLSSTKCDITSAQFGGDWSTNITLESSTTVADWVSGYEGRLKRVGDLVWFQGRIDPLNSNTSGWFTRIATIATAAYIPARDVAYPIIGYYDRGSSVTGYEVGRCHVYTNGEIKVTVPGVWKDYQWVDLTFCWSTQ